MGLYKKETFKKDKNGKWKSINCEIENAPHDVGTWLVDKSYNKRSKDDGETYFKAQTTRTGMNKKVNYIASYFNNKTEKVVRTLITTSNTLSKKDSEKYKDIKNCKYFCK